MYVRITKHAHEQYQERVEPIDIDELTERCEDLLRMNEYTYYKHGFIHLAGVWWVYDDTGDHLVFVTCYGRTEMDIPKALQWAAQYRDRINLGELI